MIERLGTKESEPKQTIVELGPNDRPLVWRLTRDGEARYKIGGETLFRVKSGDTFVAVDLPPERSVDVFRFHITKQESFDREKGTIKSHLPAVKKWLDEFLPAGAKGEVLHADGQRLPLADGSVDVFVMRNVMGGHVKDDEMWGFAADKRRILREKQNLIKEAKVVLKMGGKLIIEEGFSAADSVRKISEKILEDIKSDPDFSVRTFSDYEDGILVWELTKQAA